MIVFTILHAYDGEESFDPGPLQTHETPCPFARETIMLAFRDEQAF